MARSRIEEHVVAALGLCVAPQDVQLMVFQSLPSEDLLHFRQIIQLPDLFLQCLDHRGLPFAHQPLDAETE